MKMLLVTAHFISSSSGGEGHRALQLMKFAKKEGIHTTTLTYDWGIEKSNEIINEDIIKIKYINQRFKFPIFGFQKIKSIIRAINSSDVVNIMGYWSLLNVLIFPLLLFKSKPYIICSAGSLKITGRSQILKSIFNFLVGKKILQNADKCIIIVDDELPHYLPHGVKSDKIFRIPNGIDIEENIIKNDIKIINNLDLKSNYILFVGRLNYIKGPDLLLDSFISISKKFPSHNLVFIGNDEGLKLKMIKKVKEHKLNKRVFFLGFKNLKEKSVLYSNASLIVIPSRSEAMSIVFLEAAIHKVPIIISDNCGLNNIEKFDFIKICKASVNEIAKSIIFVLQNKTWREDASERLYKYVINKYSWHKVIKSYSKIFQQVIDKPKNQSNSFFLILRQINYFIKTKNFVKLNKYPQATHAPLLIGLSQKFKIKTVLELGSGDVSTSIFLNSLIFKDLTKLKTYEDNFFWFNKIKAKFKDNKKWDFCFTDKAINEVVYVKEEKKSYDLIFIDDSVFGELRALTIINALKIKNKFLIVHDYENRVYQDVLKNLNDKIIVKSLTPQTVILYKGNDKLKVEKIIDKINLFSNKIEVNDYKKWVKVFK